MPKLNGANGWEGDNISRLSLYFFIISVLITVGIFYLINYLTQPVLIGGFNTISNGNPGLFPLIFLTPFLIFSIIGTFDFTYIFAKRTLQTMQFKIVMAISLVGPIVISFFTIKRAREIKTLLFNNSDSFTKIDEIPLLSMYSNSTFFNGWTLLALLFTITFFAYCTVLVREKQSRRKN